MYTLLLLLCLSVVCGFVVGITTNFIIGYVAYGLFVTLAIVIFIGISAVISYLTPKIEHTNIYNVIELTDDAIVIDVGNGHAISFSRDCVTETVMRGETCPKLEIITFHIDNASSRWFIPVCFWPDLWTLYI